MTKDRKYELRAGEMIFLEGKHGIIQINCYKDYTVIHADEKTDTKRVDAQ